MHLARTRILFFLAFIACALITGTSVYLERVVDLAVDPLCLIQRFLFTAYGLVCFAAMIHVPGRAGWRGYSVVIAVIALTGSAIAARQVMLQAAVPDDVVSCLLNQQNLIDTLPFFEVVWQMLSGQSDCSEITWSLFDISIPEWSLLAFAGLSVFALYYFFIEFRRSGSMDTGASD